MKLIRTEDAVGQVLCHDITQIIPGQFKGARFRKGHIVQPEDIPVLLSIGKENLYVWEKPVRYCSVCVPDKFRFHPWFGYPVVLPAHHPG